MSDEDTIKVMIKEIEKTSCCYRGNDAKQYAAGVLDGYRIGKDDDYLTHDMNEQQVRALTQKALTFERCTTDGEGDDA
jgi:ethanolamine utilization microcompartment shell protein EutL